MFLLDTDILSNLLKPSPSATLIAKLATISGEYLFTSSINLGELIYGAHRAGSRRTVLLNRIDEILLPDRPVLPFDLMPTPPGLMGH